MSTKDASRFARLVREALAIFVGVAAALAGQAWFEERADRIAEREVLTGVVTEIEANQSAVSAAQERVRQRRVEFRELHRFLGSADARENPDSILDLAPRLMMTGGSGVVSSAIDDALETGQLRLIKGPDVRGILSAYQNGLRVVRERFDDHQDWTNQHVRSFLIKHARVDDYVDAAGFVGEDSLLPPTRFTSGGEVLLASREFENTIRDQILWHAEIEANLVGLSGALEYTLDALREELAR